MEVVGPLGNGPHLVKPGCEMGIWHLPNTFFAHIDSLAESLDGSREITDGWPYCCLLIA